MYLWWEQNNKCKYSYVNDWKVRVKHDSKKDILQSFKLSLCCSLKNIPMSVITSFLPSIYMCDKIKRLNILCISINYVVKCMSCELEISGRYIEIHAWKIIAKLHYSIITLLLREKALLIFYLFLLPLLVVSLIKKFIFL